MEETLTDSTEVIADSNDTNVESQTPDNVDVWDENFSVEDGEPTQEVQETEPVKEPATIEDAHEYITEGLGDLDKPLVVKVKGKVYDLKSMDQIRDLVEKGFMATQKTQQLAELKRELMKEQNPDITNEDMALQETEDAVERISQEILNSDIAEDFKGVISSIPTSDREQFRQDPNLLGMLQVDVKNGLTKKIMPSVERYMALENMSFREAYGLSAKNYYDSMQMKDNRVKTLTSVPDNTSSVTKTEKQDIWDMSDKEYRSLMSTERR